MSSVSPDLTRKTALLLGLALFLLAVTAHGSAVRGGFVWDDTDNVTENRPLRTTDGLRRIWTEPGAVIQYYPLTYTSFWVEYHLWGLNPAGFHAVNVVLHGLNAVLVWIVLWRISIPGAWLAAALFAIHPVNVESVAWVTERKNVLSGFFYLTALLAYLRFFDTTDKRWNAAALILFVCALLSKTAFCTLPVAILLIVWWKRGRCEWEDAEPLMPMFIAAAGMGVVTIWMEKHVSEMGWEWAFSGVDRILICGRALIFYAGKLVWPSDLAFIYPRWTIDARAVWQYLFPAAAAAGLAALWMGRERIGRAPFAAMAFFVVTLAPALGLINFFFMRYSFVADRFQYLACIGPFALAAAFMRGRFKIVAAVVLIVLGILTWRQTLIYRHEGILWRDTIAKNPDAWMAHNNLGHFLARQGRIDEAGREFTESLRIQPDNVSAHVNLGNAMAARGDTEGALAHYSEALKFDPDDAVAHYTLGTALARQGKSADALLHFSEAVRLKPTYAEAHNNLGVALAKQGNVDEAIKHFAEALRLNPDFTKAQENLDRALYQWEARPAGGAP